MKTGLVCLDQIFKKGKHRMFSNVLLKLLHGWRSRGDPHKMKGVEVDASSGRLQIMAHVVNSMVLSITHRLMHSAIENIEKKAEKINKREHAFSRIEEIFEKQRFSVGRVILLKISTKRKNGLDGYCQGGFILYKFFLYKNLLQKYQFFSSGRKLFETERLSIPMGAIRENRRIVRSNSLIVARSGNYQIGFSVLDHIYTKKMSEYFK